MIRKLTCITALLALAACGGAEIVTPSPLFVLDTYPGQGAVVPADDLPVVLTFSAPVDADTLEAALLLEEASEAGTPVRVVPATLVELLDEDRVATFRTPALTPDTAYTLTLDADTLRAADGAAPLADLVRRFRTRPE